VSPVPLCVGVVCIVCMVWLVVSCLAVCIDALDMR
jgi:hypothetical protein